MSTMPTLARNLYRFRELRGLTLSGLSQSCGVAKSTLSQLEYGQGNPTVETLWAIANTLEIPFGVLVSDPSNDYIDFSRNVGREISGVNVRFIERATGDPEIEIYSIEIEPGHLKNSAPHPPGVIEKVVVVNGEMLVGDAARPKLLRTGESHTFAADIPHVYGTLHGSARAMVFIEYPRQQHAGSDATAVLDWPQSADGWEGVRSVVSCLLLEVSNGVVAGLLRFRDCTANAKTVRREIHANVITHAQPFSWPLHVVAGVDRQGAWLAVLPLRFTDAFSHSSGHSEYGCLPIMDDSVRMSRLAEAPFIALSAPETCGLQKTSAGSSWILSPLASEVALQRGALLLPSQLNRLTRRNLKPVRANDDEAFSSRIDVEHYDAFELLHPAYARQVVAMAQDIVAFSESTGSLQTIDIGTGTGVPLLMLHELLPNLHFLAVEPDNTAFAFLTENTRGVDVVKRHHGGFLELDMPAGQAPLLTSVGASHHFNTAFMLQKSMLLLQPGGVLTIADEFLPEFHSQAERQLALVRHHSAYIVSTMAWIERMGPIETDDEDSQFYEDFKQALALAIIDAECGNAAQAVKSCRDLYTSLKQLQLSKRPAHVIGNYTRFFWLELQAMVAGFDYEVERKTYARRFADLARMSGFELLRHRQVFATTGTDEWSGGTHVFTFRKPHY